MIKKNLGSKNVAEFLAKYITAYTKVSADEVDTNSAINTIISPDYIRMGI